MPLDWFPAGTARFCCWCALALPSVRHTGWAVPGSMSQVAALGLTRADLTGDPCLCRSAGVPRALRTRLCRCLCPRAPDPPPVLGTYPLHLCRSPQRASVRCSLCPIFHLLTRWKPHCKPKCWSSYRKMMPIGLFQCTCRKVMFNTVFCGTFLKCMDFFLNTKIWNHPSVFSCSLRAAFEHNHFLCQSFNYMIYASKIKHASTNNNKKCSS